MDGSLSSSIGVAKASTVAAGGSLIKSRVGWAPQGGWGSSDPDQMGRFDSSDLDLGCGVSRFATTGLKSTP